MKNTNISLEEDLWERAQIYAIRERVSFTELVRRALAHYIDDECRRDKTILPNGTIRMEIT